MIIPIVFGVDANYKLPLQVTMVSLMENRVQGTEYDIYVLHADDYKEDSIIQLKRTIEKYHGVNLNFIAMGKAYDHAIVSHPAMTKATFYRLSIHKLLPDAYDRCIYCDCDTIINCDLGRLFQTGFQGCWLAGAADPAIRYAGYREGYGDLGEYINAGVLVINLKKWREAAIEKLFHKYMGRRLKYHDQDILNLACKGKILVLDKDRYVVSGILNRRKYRNVKPVIVHYCGLIKPWDMALLNPYFQLWTHYAKKADICMEALRLEERRAAVDNYLRENQIKRVIVWGMTASTLDLCYGLEELGLQVLAIGDNDKEKTEQGNEYYRMIDAEGVCDYKEQIHCIVNSANYFEEIRNQLMSRGIPGDKIISWATLKSIML